MGSHRPDWPSRRLTPGQARKLLTPRVAYTEGMGWRVMAGGAVRAGGFDTREEAQAWIDGK